MRLVSAAAIIAALIGLSACQLADRRAPERASSAPDYPELGELIGGILHAVINGCGR